MRVRNAGWAVWWLVRPVVLIAALIVVIWVAAAAGLTMTTAVAILLLWVLPIFVGYRLHLSKDRDSPIVLAVLLGWVGVLFALALPQAGQRCPACAETIRRQALVCRFCGAEVEASAGV
jgi:hypothetical protein